MTRRYGSNGRRRRKYAPKPVVLPEPTDIRKAKHLPMFGPGIPVKVPLHLWPAYQDMYHLQIDKDLADQQPKFKPIGLAEMPPLLVKRVAPKKEVNHEQEDLLRDMQNRSSG